MGGVTRNRSHEHDYDPCREYLRLIAAVVCAIACVVLVYPMVVGVGCYNTDYDSDGKIGFLECKQLASPTVALALIIAPAIVEIFLLMLFFYACRHEFCCRKRHYDFPMKLSCGGSISRTQPAESTRSRKQPINHKRRAAHVV